MRIGLRICVAAFAAVVLLLPPAPARADPGCSLSDLANDIANAVSSVTSSSCASACADGVGCGITTGLTGGLVAAQAVDSNAVAEFCNAVNTALGDLNSVQNIVNSSPALSSIASFIADAASIGLDPLNIAECACDLENSLANLGNAISACSCDVAALLGSSCNCSPPPPAQAACAATNADCGSWTTQNDQACLGGTGNSTIIIDPNQGTSPPVVQVNGPNGTYVTQHGSTSVCGPSWSCFCPKPMVPVWVTDQAKDGPNATTQIFACECPSGTWGSSQPSKSGLVNGISVCVCQNTGQPIMSGYGATYDNPCPAPLTGLPCPSGQKRVGDKCVAACTGDQVLLANGTCCDAMHANWCGMCCPSGQLPNASGACAAVPNLPRPGPPRTRL